MNGTTVLLGEVLMFWVGWFFASMSGWGKELIRMGRMGVEERGDR
jgi:hypothetical protein